MADKSLFASAKSSLPRADAVNEAGGVAYALAPKHALAQLAATGCFQGTFYATAEDQLDALLKLVGQVDDDLFLARLAVYARERAYMKDMPAALLVVLSKRDPALFQRAFDRVVDNGRMLRTMFQMIRSGRLGRTSLSSSLQRAFQRWLNQASVGALLSASIGNDPSLRDVLRAARPTPEGDARRALFGWLTGKEVSKWSPATEADLPAEVRALEAYRAAETGQEQARILKELSVRWDLLSGAAKGPAAWKKIVQRMGPQALRMNLNTLARQKVFVKASGKLDGETIDYVAERIADPEEVRRSRQFPYQYLAAYKHASEDVPQKIRTALHDAAEIACGNVPALPGPVVIGLDVSGSMGSAVTGARGTGATSAMRCVDVAALFAAAILRRNPDSVVIPFDTFAHEARIDPSDSILSLADRLARYGGGGTDCSIPLATANSRYADRDFAGAILVSDNESWVGEGRHGSTAVMTEWRTMQKRLRSRGVASPKLVCIDLQPYGSTQAPESDDVLNVGGFSDAVFGMVASYFGDDAGRFVAEVDAIEV